MINLSSGINAYSTTDQISRPPVENQAPPGYGTTGEPVKRICYRQDGHFRQGPFPVKKCPSRRLLVRSGGG